MLNNKYILINGLSFDIHFLTLISSFSADIMGNNACSAPNCVKKGDCHEWAFREAWFDAIITDILCLYFLVYSFPFASLSLGKAFTHKNASRLKKIAFVIIASQITGPLIDYFVWRSTLQHISFNTSGVQLFPPLWNSILGPNPDLIILGLALLVLSGVLKEAKQMSDEQRLTIWWRLQ